MISILESAVCRGLLVGAVLVASTACSAKEDEDRDPIPPAQRLTEYVRRLGSTRTSSFDAFLGVNGLPSGPGKGQSAEAFAQSLLARISKLEKQKALKTHKGFGREALAGLVIFMRTAGETGTGNCVSCHPPPLFTDTAFHGTGVAQGSRALKTPTLRNLEYTDPYMHDGAYHSLEEAVAQKVKACALAGSADLGSGDVALPVMRITRKDVAPLVAFLSTLSDLPSEEFEALERRDSIEKKTKVHRLSSTKRAVYDAFVYVNRIPEQPGEGESASDLAGRIFGRLANQEGRILLKLPPGMDRDAYLGFKTFFRYEGPTRVGNCASCHTPPEFTDAKSHIVREGGSPKSTPSLRNPARRKVDLRKAVLDKMRASHEKRSGDADEVADAYSGMNLSQKDILRLVAFLQLLNDVPDPEFRGLILNASVLDTSDIEE